MDIPLKNIGLVIFIYFFIACGNKTKTTATKEIESVKVLQDSIQAEILLQKTRKADAEREEQRKWDSISQHRTDSLRKAIKYMKNHKNISISQRISRIKNLMNADKYAWSDLYDLYGETSDRDELVGNEIGLLMMDSMAIHYNIDSLFKNTGIYVSHSEDNRIWVFSWCEFFNGTGNEPINVIVWRDTLNKPQGFVTSYSKDFQHLVGLAYWHKIYKLNDKLYLLLGESKDWGNSAITVELTSKGINLKYGGFKVKGIFQYAEKYKCIELPNGRRVIYQLGYMPDDFFPYMFNEENQKLTFRATSLCYYHLTDTLITGTLTFNGEYFTENLKKQKYE